MRSLDFDKLNAVLLDSVLNRMALEELYSRVSACLELPLICFDTSFRLVAYAFSRPFYYQHWENIAKFGKAPESAVLDYDYLKNQELMYSNGRSLLFETDTCCGYPQACGPVLIGDKLVAYCGIMLEDCQPQDALRANDLLAAATSLLIREGNQAPDLEEKLLVKNEIGREEAEKLRAQFETPYAFIIVSAHESGVSTLEYTKGILCAPGKKRLGCRASEKHLYILQYGIQNRRELEDIGGIVSTYGLSCGVSDKFEDMEEIAVRRAQAMLSLTVGAGGLPGRMATFRDSYSQIVECCALEFFGPSAVKLPGIEQLAREDMAGEGDYISTLGCYLSSFRRHSSVAKALGLHRNTVINRIKRIEKLLDMDISRPGSQLELLIGIDMHCRAENREVEHVGL